MTFPFPTFMPSVSSVSNVGSIISRGGVFVTTDTASPSSSIINFGANAGTKRYVVAVGIADVGITINSVTVAGVSATALTSQINQGARGLRFYYVDTAATGTQTVSASLSAVSSTTVFGVWELGSLVLPFDTKTNIATNATTISTNIDVPKNGGVIAAALYGDGAPGTNTWVGVTEHIDNVSEGSFSFTAGVASAPLSQETGRLIEVTNTQTITDMILIALSF